MTFEWILTTSSSSMKWTKLSHNTSDPDEENQYPNTQGPAPPYYIEGMPMVAGKVPADQGTRCGDSPISSSWKDPES